VPVSRSVYGTVTHYGVQYNGRSMGCRGSGVYSSDDPSIIAVGPSRYREWGCGTMFQVCGAAGCIIGMRRDACPGCGPNHLDLSESGIAAVCGAGAGRCRVQIEVVQRH